MNVLILDNLYSDIKISRLPLGEYLNSKGFSVSYACPSPKNKFVHDVPMLRSSISFNSIFRGITKLLELEKSLDIDVVVSFRFMPNVYNLINSFFLPNKKRVIVITGLGHVFSEQSTSLKNILMKVFIKYFYRLCSFRLIIVSQNQDDLNELGIKKAIVIRGSGGIGEIVDKKLNNETLRFLYVGRLLKQKGISTVKDVFENILKLNPKSTLKIAGTFDEQNPDNINEEDFKDLINLSGVEYLGYVDDLSQVYLSSDVILFPSKYREGIPRVLIESLRYGLTIVTYDMPGCKETIRKNGFLVSSRDKPFEISAKLSTLNAEKLSNNSKHSHELYKSVFHSDIIFREYESLLNSLIDT